MIDGGADDCHDLTDESCVNEFHNVIVSFDYDADVAEAYMKIKRGEVLNLTKFGILPFEEEAQSVIQSELPLSLKRVSESIWHLSQLKN